MSLHLNFTNENAAIIDNDSDPRIEIAFRGAAQSLTRRAKAEIALAARTAYHAEAQRITDGNLTDTHVYNEDGSLGTEREVKPVGAIV